MIPVLECVSSVWDPSTKENIDKLEKLLKKKDYRFNTGEYLKLTRIKVGPDYQMLARAFDQTHYFIGECRCNRSKH